MLKGEPLPEDKHTADPYSIPKIAVKRELPTQKVHNLVDELFAEAGGRSHSATAQEPRRVSAERQSIKHMPTPTSCVTRSAAKTPVAEADAESASSAPASAQRGLARAAVAQVSVGDALGASGCPQAERRLVWVPNPCRRQRPDRPQEADGVRHIVVNEELDQHLQADGFQQRQAALMERARERSQLSTARMHRFYRPPATGCSSRHHNVDLFKLPPQLLSEVIRHVDGGEPMTNDSLAKMVEQAAGAEGVSFQQYVLQQRRMQLHHSDSRNVREPQKHSRSPVFLLDELPPAEAAAKRRLPPIKVTADRQRQQQQQQQQQQVATTVTGQWEGRRLVSDCQLMLGPVPETARSSPATLSSRRQQQQQQQEQQDDGCSLDVECRSGRSTLLEEVLPTQMLHQPRTDSELSLMALRAADYELDDPWHEQRAQHPTRNSQQLDELEQQQQQQQQKLLEQQQLSIAVSLTTTSPREASAMEAKAVAEGQEQAEDGSPASGRYGDSRHGSQSAHRPQPPPPSPEAPKQQLQQQELQEQQQELQEQQQDDGEADADSQQPISAAAGTDASTAEVSGR